LKVEVKQEMILGNKIRVNFIGKNSERAQEDFITYIDDFIALKIPDNWKKPFTNMKERKFMKYVLDKNSAEFLRI
jgi:hypothetical protein